jgi:hypothetical protein
MNRKNHGQERQTTVIRHGTTFRPVPGVVRWVEVAREGTTFSGTDWHGRYGRRPNPRLRGESKGKASTER